MREQISESSQNTSERVNASRWRNRGVRHVLARHGTDYVPYLLILSISLILAWEYFTRVDVPYLQSRLELHSEIISGGAPSPYRYRVLVPFLLEVVIQSLTLGISRAGAFNLAYGLYDLFAIFLLLVTLLKWVQNWFTREQALIGVLFVGASMPLAFRDHFFQPWSLIEVPLLTVALIACCRRRVWSVVALTLLASLNRETGLIIPFAFLLINYRLSEQEGDGNAHPLDAKTLLIFCALMAVWALVYFGVRGLQGRAPHVLTVGELVERNTRRQALLFAAIHIGLFFGAMWPMSVIGFKCAPTVLRRLVAVAILYLGLVAVFGVWVEVRLLMPLYPIIVPLALHSWIPANRMDHSGICPAQH